jgi:hypothetical protein
MCKTITVDSKLYEILSSDTSKGLVDIVNDAMEKGYEPLWGSVMQENHSPALREMIYSYELGTTIPAKITKIENHYLQAVILKNADKFNAWASEQKQIAETLKAQKEEEERFVEEIRAKQNERIKELNLQYLGKPLTYTPKIPGIKGGTVIVKQIYFTGLTYAGATAIGGVRIVFVIQRVSNRGYIQNVEPSELGLEQANVDNYIGIIRVVQGHP